MPYLNDRVIDNGLASLKAEADKIYVCSAEPATFTAAISTNALGNKNFGAGSVFGAIAARSPNGRKLTSVAVTDGSTTLTGTATHFATVDSANSRLLAAATLSASQVVTSPNLWTLGTFEVGIPGLV